MIKIGKIYIMRQQGISRLCADIAIGKKKSILWFAVDSAQETYLCGDRADAFVIALLPTAIRDKHEIICEDFMTERLLYQLNGYLIPALIGNRESSEVVQIHASYTRERYSNSGAIGTVFLEDVESFYTIMNHSKDCEYPLTHIVVFNVDAFGRIRDQVRYKNACFHAKKFAKKQGLQVICVDTNIYKVLHENLTEVYSFRKFACIFALQGLFSIFLVPAQYDAAHFELDLLNAAKYDLLIANCVTTDSLVFYYDGGEANYLEKIKALIKWKPSWLWLPLCIKKIGRKIFSGIKKSRECI